MDNQKTHWEERMSLVNRRSLLSALPLASLFAFANHIAWAEEEVLIFGTDPTYRPLAFYDENNTLVGFDIDLAEAMAKQLNIKFKIEAMAFDGLIPALQTGRIHVEPEMAVREKRKTQVDFTTPFFS